MPSKQPEILEAMIQLLLARKNKAEDANNRVHQH